MTARELLRHCFSWEIAPGIAAPEALDQEGSTAPDEERSTGTQEPGEPAAAAPAV